MATVIAKTSCRLLVLHANKFREVVQDKAPVNKPLTLDFDLFRVQRYRPFVR